MKLLYHNGELIGEAESIVKTATDIIGYTKGVEVFAFRGVGDFSVFQVEGGDFDHDPDIEKEQRLADIETAIAAILGGGA